MYSVSRITLLVDADATATKAVSGAGVTEIWTNWYRTTLHIRTAGRVFCRNHAVQIIELVDMFSYSDIRKLG